jgi:hypothetical protein
MMKALINCLKAFVSHQSRDEVRGSSVLKVKSESRLAGVEGPAWETCVVV